MPDDGEQVWRTRQGWRCFATPDVLSSTARPVVAFHESCSSPIVLTLTPTNTVPTLARMMNSRAGTLPTSPSSFNHKGENG
jgi:hypothetical protein